MKNLKWKLLSSTYLIKEHWLTARKDRCEMPDGRIVDPYFVMEYDNWVNAVAVTKEGKIILIKQYRHALGEVSLEIPGGCIDPEDADPEAGMRRELLEETGYQFEKMTPLGIISANPSTNDNITYMFLAEGGEKVQGQDLDPNEEIEIYTYSPEEVFQLLMEHQMMQSLHVSCLFYGLKQLGLLSFNGDLRR